MLPYQLALIGGLKLKTAGGTDLLPRSKRAKALLGALALTPGGSMSRAQLASLLWERAEPNQARALLRGVLHEISSSLGQEHAQLLKIGRDHIALQRDKVSLDIEDVFEHESAEAARAALSPAVGSRPLSEVEPIGPAFGFWLATAQSALKARVEAELSRLSNVDRVQDASLAAHVQNIPYVFSRNERGGRRGVNVGVAPFQVIGDGLQSVLANLVSDEISAALASLRWLSVKPSGALAGSADQPGGVLAAAERLALDYVVEGQLIGYDGRIALRTSLICVPDRVIIGSFKAEHALVDFLRVQDEMAAQVATNVDLQIQLSEARRVAARPSAASAHEFLMQAVSAVCRLDQMSFAKASELIERALRLDPEHAPTRVGSAQLQMVAASQGWAADPRAALRRAEEEASTALAIDPFETRAVTIAGHVRGLLHRQPGDAVELHRRALEMHPNLPFALHFSAANDLIRGDFAGAKASLERHRQLVAPTGQHLFVNSAVILLHLLEGNYAAAASLSRAVLNLSPNFAAVYKPYLAALGHLGLHAEARNVRARLSSLDPSLTMNGFMASAPFRRPQDVERFAVGLRLAGLS